MSILSSVMIRVEFECLGGGRGDLGACPNLGACGTCPGRGDSFRLPLWLPALLTALLPCLLLGLLLGSLLGLLAALLAALLPGMLPGLEGSLGLFLGLPRGLEQAAGAPLPRALLRLLLRMPSPSHDIVRESKLPSSSGSGTPGRRPASGSENSSELPPDISVPMMVGEREGEGLSTGSPGESGLPQCERLRAASLFPHAGAVPAELMNETPGTVLQLMVQVPPAAASFSSATLSATRVATPVCAREPRRGMRAQDAAAQDTAARGVLGPPIAGGEPRCTRGERSGRRVGRAARAATCRDAPLCRVLAWAGTRCGHGGRNLGEGRVFAACAGARGPGSH